MARQIRLAVFVASVATVASIDIPGAHATPCSSGPPAGHHGYWSYRLIDGRKCWYAGKTMIPKSSLEWSARAPARAMADDEPARESRDKPGPPMDANAWVTDEVDTFEARWRAINSAH